MLTTTVSARVTSVIFLIHADPDESKHHKAFACRGACARSARGSCARLCSVRRSHGRRVCHSASAVSAYWLVLLVVATSSPPLDPLCCRAPFLALACLASVFRVASVVILMSSDVSRDLCSCRRHQRPSPQPIFAALVAKAKKEITIQSNGKY